MKVVWAGSEEAVLQTGRGAVRSKRRMAIPPMMSSRPITEDGRIVSPTMMLMRMSERNGDR